MKATAILCVLAGIEVLSSGCSDAGSHANNRRLNELQARIDVLEKQEAADKRLIDGLCKIAESQSKVVDAEMNEAVIRSQLDESQLKIDEALHNQSR